MDRRTDRRDVGNNNLDASTVYCSFCRVFIILSVLTVQISIFVWEKTKLTIIFQILDNIFKVKRSYVNIFHSAYMHHYRQNKQNDSIKITDEIYMNVANIRKFLNH